MKQVHNAKWGGIRKGQNTTGLARGFVTTNFALEFSLHQLHTRLNLDSSPTTNIFYRDCPQIPPALNNI